MGVNEFVILQRLPEAQWQLQNTATGEWCTFPEADLLDLFAHSELSFVIAADEGGLTDRLAISLARDLSFYSPELVAIDMTPRVIQPLIRELAEEIADPNPPDCLQEDALHPPERRKIRPKPDLAFAGETARPNAALKTSRRFADSMNNLARSPDR
jgi:hypothetical protein